MHSEYPSFLNRFIVPSNVGYTRTRFSAEVPVCVILIWRPGTIESKLPVPAFCVKSCEGNVKGCVPSPPNRKFPRRNSRFLTGAGWISLVSQPEGAEEEYLLLPGSISASRERRFDENDTNVFSRCSVRCRIRSIQRRRTTPRPRLTLPRWTNRNFCSPGSNRRARASLAAAHDRKFAARNNSAKKRGAQATDVQRTFLAWQRRAAAQRH